MYIDDLFKQFQRLPKSPVVKVDDQEAVRMRLMCISAAISPESLLVGRQYAVPGSLSANITRMRSLAEVGSSIWSKVNVGEASAGKIYCKSCKIRNMTGFMEHVLVHGHWQQSLAI